MLCQAGGMLDELWEANRRYAAGHRHGDQTMRPRRRLAVLTCMDCRIDPLAVLGLELGDAVVVRNAGARATDDALRSLGLATRLLGVEQVVVMHHYDCALSGQSEDEARRRLEAAGAPDVGTWELLAMPDPDAALREDVDAVVRCTLVPPSLEVAGTRYDEVTGLVSVVVESARS